MTTSGFGGEVGSEAPDDGAAGFDVRCQASENSASAVSLSGSLATGISIGSTFGTWMSTSAENATPGFNACNSAGVRVEPFGERLEQRRVTERHQLRFLHHVLGHGGEGAGGVFRR